MMTTPIALFLVFGAFFGLATYSRRHLFSEGPRRPDDPQSRDPLDGRLLWVAICTCLWPMMVLTGMFSLWRRSRQPVPIERDRRR
jgi:hypothetical protein